MSRRNNRAAPDGFTMVELLVVTVILSLIIVITVTAYDVLNRMWKEDVALSELCRNANIAFEKMGRGVSANTGILPARSIESPAIGASDTSINYTDMNGVSRRFYYSSGRILAETGDSILSDVESVTFYNVDHMARIDLILSRRVGKRDMVLSLGTQAGPRN